MAQVHTTVGTPADCYEKYHRLRQNGFVIGARDPRINSNYAGRFMVVEDHDESELPTKDGRNGPWAVVGDDLDALIDAAWNAWEGDLS